MAKSLPYFKFYCSEWNDGDVTLEDYKTQGVFINICSYYWSQECDISEEKLLKRFKKSQKQIENLTKAEIIFFINGKLLIKFLEKQWLEREVIKHKNQANGLKGGRPKITQSVNSGLANGNPNESHIEEEEKRIEEEKKVPKKFFDFIKNYPKKTPQNRIAYTRQAWEDAVIRADGEDVLICAMNLYASFVAADGSDPKFCPKAQDWLETDDWRIDWQKKERELSANNKTTVSGVSDIKPGDKFE